MSPKLFRRDFTLMVIGQIISLFGNAILRFALSLYVLTLTGSAAAFGGIMALSMVPMVFCSPLGGVAADRLPRQRIMAVLDFITAALVLLSAAALGSGGLAVVTALMLALSTIQSFYQPSVTASIPLLADGEQLMAANSTVALVQALASLLGPILGGLLYSIFGLRPILTVSAACFFASAVLELFLHIPYEKPGRSYGALKQIAADLAQAARFLQRERPALLAVLLLLSSLNLFLAGLYTVGLPYLIKVHLGLSDLLYSYSQAALGLGSILGGVLPAILGKHMPIRRSYWYLLGVTVLLLPMALVLTSGTPALLAYGVIIATSLAGMVCVTAFNVSSLTFFQKSIPAGLLGKVSSFANAISTCALPLGQALYGALFELAVPWLVVVFALTSSAAISLLTGKAIGKAAVGG